MITLCFAISIYRVQYALTQAIRSHYCQSFLSFPYIEGLTQSCDDTLLFFNCLINCFLLIRKSKKARKKIEKGSDVLDKSNKRDGSSDSQSRRKRSRLTNSDNDDSFPPRMDIRIAIPQELQHWLVDDWDLITRQKQLVPLPRKKTVHHILQDYVQSIVDNPNGVRLGVAEEMTQGIKEYFNVMLGTQLLYRFERPQYGDLLSDMPNKSMCEIYGVEHLLRLFIRLGSALSYSNFDEKSMQFVVSCIQDFLNYLSREAETLFSLDYVNATPEYHRRATT